MISFDAIGYPGDILYHTDDFPYTSLRNNGTTKGRDFEYCKTFMTFDIESTTYKHDDKVEGFMYIWQAAIGEDDCIAVHGRTWFSFLEFLHSVKQQLCLSDKLRMVVYVHYLSYEFQFIHRFLPMKDMFATDERKVLRCTYDCFEFRCSYKLSNMSLDKFCKYTGAKHRKKAEHFDYSVIRTVNTRLWLSDYYYCFCDVVGLHEAIRKELEEDTLSTIPMTSTGYVRRDCRNAMKKNQKNYEWFRRCAISPEVYVLIKEAMRGGDTHCNRRYAGEILEDVDCYDFASSYPYVLMTEYFPVSNFIAVKEIKNGQFQKYLDKYCCLFRVYFKNLRIKKTASNPYISLSKCTGFQQEDTVCFNGRVLSSPVIGMTLTELDFQIIEHDYKWDGIAISDLHIATRGQLPEELKEVIRYYFQKKTDLKGFDAYLYGKSKNKLNAVFGMACTDPIHEIIYIMEGEWKSDAPDLKTALYKYKKNRNNFLPYQVGLYTTAHARRNLRDIIWIAGVGNVYNDTDSAKVWGVDITEEVENYNREVVIPKAEKYKAYAVDRKGNKVYMGVAEKEQSYEKFRSWGAKKYAYVQDGKLNLTLAGVAKDKGVRQLKDISNFRIGKVFYPDCGRTTSWYNDDDIHYITVDGCTMITGSNIGVLNGTYKLGVTDEFIANLPVDIDTLNEL